MSFFYSLVIAGLLFSSNGGNSITIPEVRTSLNSITTIGQQDETEKFEQSYPLSANGRVSVSNVNGSILVESWDRNEVHLEATKVADSKETLADVELKIDSNPDSFSVETEYKDWKWKENSDKGRSRKLEVQFKLSVPRNAILDEVETVNGSVTVSNFTNLTKVSAVNGNVNASNLRGTASLSTVNGEVMADFERLEPGSKIKLNTVNGRVNLTIPSDANATIKADSLNGEISNEFGLPVRKGEYIGRDLYGRVGTGEVQIKLDSVNGPLAINRRKDGRSPNPVTNLLPDKKSGDKNWDDSDLDSSMINTEKMNREISRAMRDAQRSSEVAVRQAQAAIDNARLSDLKDLKVKIDEKAIEKSIAEGMKAQQEALSRMKDAMWLGGTPRIERRSKSFGVKDVPDVTVDAKNCSVRVHGWNRSEVKYVLSDISQGRLLDPSEKSTATDEQKGSAINIKVTTDKRDSFRGWPGSGADGIRLEVYVPRKSNLKIISNGEIRLEGVSGRLEVLGEDESIDVRDSQGSLKLTNSDGEARVIGFSGEVDARTADGNIYLDGDFAQITANSNDGSFFLTIPVDTSATISSSNANIQFESINSTRSDSERAWKIGRGEKNFAFNTDGGSVLVQSRDLVYSNN